MGEKVVKPSDMTREEFIARITKLVARNEKLEDELRESREDVVVCGGHLHKRGKWVGWWSHQFHAESGIAMRKLVQAGFWECHPENDCYARPIEKDEQEESTCRS
jgi:hypothetical protein